MRLSDYEDMSNSIKSLSGRKEELETKITEIDYIIQTVNPEITVYNHYRDNSIPLILSGYGKMSRGTDDSSFGTLRTEYEDRASVQTYIVSKDYNMMQEYLDEVNDFCQRLSFLREEYARQIEGINNEIYNIQNSMNEWERLAGGKSNG